MPESNPALRALLAHLDAALQPGVWVYVQIPPDADPTAHQPLASFREAEGWTLILEESRARAAALPVQFRAAWITLSVHSALDGVGLTAAFAHALAEAGIACNVMAGVCHDHLFVPIEQGEQALQCLRRLQLEAAGAA